MLSNNKHYSRPGLEILRKISSRPKRSQVTIFIIVGIIIVAAVVLVLLFSGKIDSPFSSKLNPQQYIEKCIKDSALEAVDIMLPQGGYLDPILHKLYEDNKIAYLCYNMNFYLPCINQEPMYIQHLEDEVKSYVEPEIEKCFNKVKSDAESSGKSFNMGVMELGIELGPGQIEVDVKRDVQIGSGESLESYKNFGEIVVSPIYDLGIVAQEIVSQEARFCNFEYLGYSLTYPKFSIEKDQVGTEDTLTDIYKIKDKISGKVLTIAIRSCALPGGL